MRGGFFTKFAALAHGVAWQNTNDVAWSTIRDYLVCNYLVYWVLTLQNR